MGRKLGNSAILGEGELGHSPCNSVARGKAYLHAKFHGAPFHRIKMPLGTVLGLGRGHIVLDGDPAPSPSKKAGKAPNFRRMSIVAKRLDGSRCHLVRK